MNMMENVKNLLTKKQQNKVHGYIGGKGPALVPYEDYLTISIHSMWIETEQVLFIKKYGAANGNIKVPKLGSKEKRTLQVLTPLVDGKIITEKDISNVILGPHYIVNSVPYYEGIVDLNVSLFSVKADNLAEMYIKILKKLAETAGVPGVSEVVEVIDTIENGVAELISAKTLCVGRQGSYKTGDLHTGLYAVTQKNIVSGFSIEDCTFDKATNKILYNNDVLDDFPYFVLEISASKEKSSFEEIPDVCAAFNAMLDQINEDDTTAEKNHDAYLVFYKLITTSIDIFPDDAKRRANKIYEDYKDHFDSNSIIFKSAGWDEHKRNLLNQSLDEALGIK